MFNLICANHRTAWPTPDELAALGADGIRALNYASAEYAAAITALPKACVHQMLCHSEHELIGNRFDPDLWEQAAKHQIAALDLLGVRDRVKWAEIFNEVELPERVLADIVNRVAPIYHAAGMLVLLGTCGGSDWQGALERISPLLDDGAIDGVCLHPYGNTPYELGIEQHPTFGYLAEATQRAHDLTGVPVHCTELGIKLRDIASDRDPNGVSGQSAWLRAAYRDLRELGDDICASAAFFSISDHMNGPSEHGMDAFGLRDDADNRRPAWHVYAEMAGGTGSNLGAPWQTVDDTTPLPGDTSPRFVLGFQKWAALEPELIGSALANERNVFPEWQTQPTSNGVLSWVGSKGHAFVTHDGRVFHWEEDWAQSQEVSA